MSTDIIEIIAADLHIKRIDSESNLAFRSRVTYSAISQWVKELVIQNYKDEIQLTGSTKASVTKQSSDKINLFLELVPETRSWFDFLSGTEIARIVRESLELVGEVRESDFNNRLAVCENNKINITPEAAIALGGYSDSKGVSSGLGMLHQASEEYHSTATTRFDENTNRMYQQKYNWEKCLSIDGYERFDPTIESQVLSDCWADLGKNLHPGKYIIRKKLAYGPDQYHLLRVNRNNKLMQIASFDEYTVVSRDYRLLYFKQRYDNQNPVIAKIHEMNPYFMLELFSRAPLYEEGILNYLSWPWTSIQDHNKRLFHINTKEYVIKLLNNIYIQVENDE